MLNFKDIVACPSATFTNVPLQRQVCCSGLSQASGSGRTKSGVSQLLAPFFSSLTGNGCLHPFVFSVWLGLSPTLAARQHVLFGRTASAHRSQIEWGQQHLSPIPSSSIPSPICSAAKRLSTCQNVRESCLSAVDTAAIEREADLG